VFLDLSGALLVTELVEVKKDWERKADKAAQIILKNYF
jgi:hypothetical protein